MNPTETDYELVARHLDGEEVTLTVAQQALAEEIAGDAEPVAAALDVAMPSGALHRVGARTARALRRSGMWRRVAWSVPVAAAAAGVVVMALLLPPQGPTTTPPPVRPTMTAAEYISLLESPADDIDARVGLLAEEVADYHVRLALGESGPLDLSLLGVEEEIEGFFLGDEVAEPMGPDLWEESL